MTSTNEELPPPPKPRASPFDYRNTDLVSRLLAATPPYLYNLPLVPHNFFFSEMLRSLVQAKTENANRNSTSVHHRRSRKRSWMQTHPEFYQHKEQKIEKPDMPPPTSWLGKNEQKYTSRLPERPLELTEKLINNNNNKINPEIQDHRLIQHQNLDTQLNILNSEKETKPNQLQFPFPQQTPPSSDLILPPPPPVWYPPLYPSPYGIDPLHFFIDLRVSGHIYDRKNQKESTSPHTTTSATSPSPSTSTQEQPAIEITHFEQPPDSFRQSRHASAFSVPSSRLNRNVPINLSNYAQIKKANETKSCTQTKDSTGRTKFDVKSMGFERACNKISSNYIMHNIDRIYKELHSCKDSEDVELKESKEEVEVVDKETEEEKEKKVKDLRALIGLELVVDYMNHSKPEQKGRISEESSTDFESIGSPAVDVVAIQEESEDYDI